MFGVKRHFQQYFSYIMATILLVEEAGVPGENHRSWGKQLVNIIARRYESSVQFFVIHKAGREPTPY